MRRIRFKKKKHSFDRKLLFLPLILTAIGIVAVADASAPLAQRVFSDKFYFVKQQVIWALVGSVLLLVTSALNYKFWERIATFLFLINLVALLLVFIPGLGVKLLGARRWIVLGPITIQPSEVLKLSISCYLAKIAAKDKRLTSYILVIVIAFFLIMLQPDLGTGIIILGIGISQIFISGASFLKFTILTIGGGLASILLIVFSDYRRDRLLTFLQQTQDPLGRSYHVRQILLALGSGGLLGVGLGASKQKQLFLPETATDSIFAVIAEEVGFLGSLVLIFLFIVFIYRAMKVVVNAPDKFSQILSIGIVAWIAGQTIINIGSMVAVFPLTGVPLPFISYGGSSLVSVMVACGILLNISKYAREG